MTALSTTDYKVKFRSEAFIADVARACRKIGTKLGSRYVDLQVILVELQAHGVESIYAIPGMKKKGRLTIEIVDDDQLSTEAQVQFSPRLILRVQGSIWKKFQEGRSKEREIIAHELGHILLHNDEAKPFSQDGTKQINFADNEDSAEWQAHRFADHLLIPIHVALEINDIDRLAFICNVTESFATERLAAVKTIKRPLNPISTESCMHCGSNMLIGERGRKRCDWCGEDQPSAANVSRI